MLIKGVLSDLLLFVTRIETIPVKSTFKAQLPVLTTTEYASPASVPILSTLMLWSKLAIVLVYGYYLYHNSVPTLEIGSLKLQIPIHTRRRASIAGTRYQLEEPQ